jgi:threonine dehydratase
VVRTPLRHSAWLSAASGAEVFLKLEVLQPTFSYKIRGALNAIARLHAGGPTRRLVTASAGNHGRALAYAAATRGIPLTVYVPETAPRTKLDAIRALGSELRTCRDYDDAEAHAKRHAASGAADYISPYSHPDVIAGAGTVGLEMIEDDPALDTIIVPVGGGGLISGIAIAAAATASKPEVIGVEAQASQPFTVSRAAGRIMPIDVHPTLADGLAGNLDPDTITFEIVERLVRRVFTVDESSIRDALRGTVKHERLIAEGATGVGLAAVLTRRVDLKGRRVGVVLSGANIDPEVLKELL